VWIVAAALPASLWLGGCAPASVADLREKARGTYSFEVPANYAAVYDRIVQRTRQRYVFTARPTLQPGVSADISAESQSATITLWDSGGIGIRYLVRAEIRAIDPTRTRMDLYAARKADNREALLWAAWADTPLEK
jgi:hypothetical protein